MLTVRNAFKAVVRNRYFLTPFLATTLVLGSYSLLSSPRSSSNSLHTQTNSVTVGHMSTDAAPSATVDSYVDASSTDIRPVVVYVTVPTAEVGEKLAEGIVTEKLAACVNILPGLTSVYSWKGEINKDPELMLIIKTETPHLKNLHAYVRRHHPYTTPEFVTLPIQGGSLEYLQWIKDSTQSTETARQE